MSIQAMKMALEALEKATAVKAEDPRMQADAIVALRQALTKEQENMERIYSSEYSTDQDCNESNIIETIIEYADYHECGQLESLRAKQNKLIEVVSEIFLRLSPKDRNDIVKALSTYSLTESKG